MVPVCKFRWDFCTLRTVEASSPARLYLDFFRACRTGSFILRTTHHDLPAIHDSAATTGWKRIFGRWHQFVGNIFRRKTAAEWLISYFVIAEIPLINAAMLYKSHDVPQTTVRYIKLNTKRIVSNYSSKYTEDNSLIFICIAFSR